VSQQSIIIAHCALVAVDNGWDSVLLPFIILFHSYFMKILLVHPDDSIDVGTWAGIRWDFAVDLGWSGRHWYAEQTRRLGFRVFSMYDLLDHAQHRDRIRQLLALGLGQLVDSQAVDWWDLFSPNLYEPAEQLLLLSALVEHIPAKAEIFATRPGFLRKALSLLLRRAGKSSEIKSFLPERRPRAIQEISRRYLRAAVTLRPAQIIEICFDKWDLDYRVRRHFARSQSAASSSVTLLPSAYGNVSRSQIAYARMLPHRQFLLVVTRRNGLLPEPPANVNVRQLAAYAPGRSRVRDAEFAQLLMRWRDVERLVLEPSAIFSVARELKVFDGFAEFLKRILRVRDAWRNVLALEPVTAVLSADENNPTTRLPILLASAAKVPTVFCDHGALNMSFAIRRAASDKYLLRGQMARDYSVEWCGLAREKVIVGAPLDAHGSEAKPGQITKDWIVLYSEAYELLPGRTHVFYAEVLPELCSLARRTNRKVVIKLHPFESGRERKAIVDKVLTAEQRNLVQLREGPMTPDLFERAWCSVTVESSVAVESTTHGVPCFLCSWLDVSWYDYGKQYAKFHAGYQLHSPEGIRKIPQLVERISITEETRQSLRTVIRAEDLESVLCAR